MNLLTRSCLLLFFPIYSIAQEKTDLSFSIASGFLTTTDYNKSRPGAFYSIDMDYYFNKRHVISTNYTDGRHYYSPYEDLSVIQNAVGYNAFSILYKYKLLSNRHIIASVGTGLGIMTHSQESYIKWRDLVFPVKVEGAFSLSNKFKLGLVGGFYVMPDYPIIAYHLGPKVSYYIHK